MATTSESIQEIYIGLLGRAADADGAAYWTAEIDAGTLTLEQLRANIVNEQAEYASGLGSLTRAQTVAELYNRLFERTADATDLAYWVDGAGSSVNIDQLVLALSNGASAADRVVLDNKTDAAEYYTANTTQANYTASGAQGAVDSVDGTSQSVTDSKASTDSGSQTSGQTFTLTTAVDALTGTSNNDTFIADNNSISAGDTLVGGAGTDTLQVFASAIVPNISGIENVYYNTPGANVDISGKSDVTAIELDSAATGRTVTVAANQAVTLDSVAAGGTTTIAGNTPTSLDLTLDGTGTAAAGNTVALTGTALATLNVTGSSNASYVTLTNAGAALTTINVAGDQTVSLTSALTTVTTVNGSTATGSTIFNTTGASNLTFTGGTGDDTVTVAGTLTTADTLDGGAGTDVIGISSGATLTAATGARATNFETLDIRGSSSTTAYDLDFLSGITKVQVGAALTANTTVQDMAADAGVEIGVDQGAFSLTLAQKDAGAGSPDDTLTVTMNAATAIASDNGSTVVVNDIETLTLGSTSTGTNITHNIDDLTSNASTKIVLDASTAGLQIDGLTATAVSLIDGSGAAKAVDVTLAAQALTNASGVAIKGGAGVDSFNLTAVTDFSATDHNMATPTYADVQLTGGAAADTFTVDATVDSEQFTFNYAAGDSVSDSSAADGYSTTLTDLVTGLVNNAAYADAAGNRAVFDTAESATAVTSGTTAVTFGTTTVTNANDFFIYRNGSDAFVYQDTDGDKIIESGEFAVKLTGAAAFADAEFTIDSGNLLFISA